MLTPKDVLVVGIVTIIGLWSVSTIAIRSLQRMTVCEEKDAAGAYVLQHVQLQPGEDDERMRKIVSNHNRILELECGR